MRLGLSFGIGPLRAYIPLNRRRRRRDVETWVRTFEHGTEYTASLSGVAWYDSPLPRRWHKCKPQTRAGFERLGHVERCACGAIQMDRNGFWLERNSRRPQGAADAFGADAGD